MLIERNDYAVMASKYGMSVESYADILGKSRKKLFDARTTRPRPHLDDKVLLAISFSVVTPQLQLIIFLLGYRAMERTCDFIVR